MMDSEKIDMTSGDYGTTTTEVNTINFTTSDEQIFRVPKMYEVDFDKVKTVEDLITVLKCMDIRVSDYHSKFDEMKPYLKEHGKD